jgi:hypothetical protein
VVARHEHSQELVRRNPALDTDPPLGAQRSEAVRPTPMASPANDWPATRARPSSVRRLPPSVPEFAHEFGDLVGAEPRRRRPCTACTRRAG